MPQREWPWSRRRRDRKERRQRSLTPGEPSQPPDAPPPADPARPWRVVGCSVRGASHVRSGLENQDTIGWLPYDGIGSHVVMSVADGHGSAKSFRSATGSQLAVEVSHGLAAELLSLAPTRSELSLVKDRLEQEVPHHIVREWRARVDAHLAKSPFTDAELALVSDRGGHDARDRVRRDPYLAYGSTLVTAVAMETFMAFWQIGDGDVVTVSADGNVGRPLPGDERLLGNETTSLCTDEAWRYFRVAVYGTPAPMILASTDGFANSFTNDEGFLQFGSDVLRIVVDEGIDAVAGMLSGWLDEMTRMGSGDDISLGIICRPADLPESLEEPAEPDQEPGTAPAAGRAGGPPEPAGASGGPSNS